MALLSWLMSFESHKSTAIDTAIGFFLLLNLTNRKIL